MENILSHYVQEGLVDLPKPKGSINIDDEIKYRKVEYSDNRHLLRIKGTPVTTNIIDKILIELKEWSNSGLKSGATRERPSIQASS